MPRSHGQANILNLYKFKLSKKNLPYFNKQHTYIGLPYFRWFSWIVKMLRNKILKMNNAQNFCLEQEMHTVWGETYRVRGFIN